MSLTLTIENVDRLENDGPTQLRLDRHGAVIGRSPHSDWSLPDPKNYISSTHCEIDYRDGQYLLIDKSTNGTLLNEGTQRIDGPQPLKDGDVVVIGHYRVLVRTKDGASASASAAPQPAQKSGWGGWDEFPGSNPAPAAPSAWDNPQAAAPAAPPPLLMPQPSSGWGSPAPIAASSPAWGAPPAPTPAPAVSDWGTPPPAPPSADSGWGSPPPMTPPGAAAWSAAPPASKPGDADPWGASAAVEPHRSGWDNLSATPAAPSGSGAWDDAPSSAVSGRGPMAQNWSAPRTEAPVQDVDDVWGRFAASNDVDWTRGGFASPAPLASTAPPIATPAYAAPATSQPDAVWAAFVAATGVAPNLIKVQPTEAAAAAGGLLKRLVAGLVVMIEARARAKAQLGAQSTTLELGGNNPLKFARGPEQALAQLLNPPERGFMDAERAIEDSFQDLQAHQMATLAAMQGALRSTVDRFSPEAIRTRAETRGLLARILPSARNAALWEAYQREFEGVARGSDEAFLDVFAKAFKAAYEKAAADMKRSGR